MTNEMKKQKKKIISLRNKMLCILLPVIIFCNSATFITTLHQTRDLVYDYATQQMVETSNSLNYQISAYLVQTIGVLENVKCSIERSCETNAELKEYLFSIADAYTDTIPAGIYCGLTDGTYLDKLWTPDADWVMEERPWYIDGLTKDELAFGEIYLDANTGQYIISAYSNLKDSSGEIIGVLCADVQLDTVDALLRSGKLFDEGYIYAIDKTSGMVLSNSADEAQNGQLLWDLTDPISLKVAEMLENKQFGKAVLHNSSYLVLNEIADTNFVSICVANEKDVEADMKALQDIMFYVAVAGVIVVSAVVYIALSYFLSPIKKITAMIDKMHALDLTERTKINSTDEFGAISSQMNLFADNLQSVMTNVQNAVNNVDEKADTNAEAATHLSNLAVEQNHSIQKLQMTMTEMADAISQIAEGASKLSSEISDTNSATGVVETKVAETISYVENGRTEMIYMTETMSQISELSLNLQDAVNNMKEGLNGINAMVGVINDVTEQTNLLSLNASIEAARAGEAGKGFAVVADEIRHLAENCSTSVIDIVATTEKMDKLVDAVIAATEDNIKKITLGNEVVERTNATFQHMQGSIDEIHSAIDVVVNSVNSIESVAADMASNTQKQNSGTESVLNDCEQMSEIAQRFHQEGVEMASSSTELKKLSDQLDELVAKFIL